MDERFGRLLALALEETDSIEEATVAAAIAYEHKAPEPLRTPPKPVGGQFAIDIYDRHAQGVLNRAMTAAKKLSAQARRDLAAALKMEPNQALDAIVRFLDRYRVQLANLLGTTQLAALLEGAREVARHVPAIPPAGMDVVPPSLGPTEAVELVERLRGMKVMEREQAIYALSPTEQRYVRQALGVVSAPPPPLRLPATPAGPESTHWPVIEEAARSLAEKNVVTSAAFYQMAHAARTKAFTITGIDAREAVTKFRDALARSAAEGPDYATFRKEILASVGEAGLLSDHHLELVYRNAIQTAFSDGQMTVLSHPFVRSGFPYSAYDAIHDDRVRANHLALEKFGIQGTNVYRMDDPVFKTFRPPWDHNDRCGWTPMTVKQAADRGIAEAQNWLRIGVEPETKAWVTPPPFVPPAEFQRSLEGMPLSIQLSMVSATEMLAPDHPPPETDTSIDQSFPLVDPYYNMGDPKSPDKPKRAKPRKGRKRRRLGRQQRTPDAWRVLSGGMAFSTDAPGPGWVSAGDGKWVRGPMLGMVGDEWHGPTAPGPGWVQVGKGPLGGKVWKNSGGGASPAQPQKQAPAAPVATLPAAQPTALPQRDPGEREASVAQAAAKNPVIGSAMVAHGRVIATDKEASAWFKQNFGRWAASLSPDETAAIREYQQDETYIPMNQAMRNPSGKDAQGRPITDYTGNDVLVSGSALAKKLVPKLDAAIAKGKLPEDVTLYRGIDPRKSGGLVEGMLSGRFKEGDTFSDPAYVSTSLLESNAGGFLGGKVNGLMLEILARKGQSAAAPDAIYDQDSAEMLLPRGTNFRVVSVDPKARRVVVEIA